MPELLARRLVVALGLAVGQPALAQTVVSGSLTGDIHWTAAGSPYLVSGTAIIGSGATLTIDAGTSIYMDAGAGVAVRGGSIKAQGTVEAPVRVMSDKSRQGQPPSPGDWNQWVFEAGGPNSRLDNVVFEYGHGLAVLGAAPVFNYLDLHNHAGAAITVDLAASPSGMGNRASGNTINGVAVPEGTVTGTVTWGLRGIPYVVTGSGVSVGAAPTVTSVTPHTVEQGERLTVSLSGSRLSGLTDIGFEQGISDISLLAGADDHGAGVSLTVRPDALPGSVALQGMTDAGPVTYASALTIEAMRPPVVTGMTPRAVNRGRETAIVVSGSSLGAAIASASTPGISISAASATRTALSFRLGVDGTVATGTYPLSITNAAGSVPLSIEILPEVSPPPPFQLIPSIIALAPDSTYHAVTFRATETAAVDRHFTVTVANSSVARLRSADLVLPAGQYEVSLGIAGLAVGNTALQVSGDGLATPLEAPVEVTSASLGQVQMSPAVGIRKGAGLNNSVGYYLSKSIGIVKGAPIGNGSGHVFSPSIRVDKGSRWYGGYGTWVSPRVGVVRE